MPSVQGKFFDGEIAHDRDVVVELAPHGLIIVFDDGTRREWPFTGLQSVNPPSSGHPLRLAHDSATGARLSLAEGNFVDDLLLSVPHLKGGFNPRRFFKAAGIVAASIAAVAAVVYGLFSYAPQQLAFVMPDQWRTRLGEQVEKSFVAGAKQCANPDSTAALNRLAARIAEGNPELPLFSLRVYDIPVINAFAMPGGRVVIFRELINRASAPDEVAGVLGHELGHIAFRHAELQLIRSVGLQLLLSLATGGGTGSDTFGSFAGLLAILSYSRGAETDADAFGLDTLKHAAIDPMGLKRFFELIAKEEGEPLKGVFGRIGGMMSTHPVTAARIQSIKPLEGTPRPVLTGAEWQALKKICG